MFKEGDIVTLKNNKNSDIYKIVGFYDYSNITYVVSKPIQIDDPDDYTICSRPQQDLKFYEPYYRLNKLKNLIK